MPFNKKNTMVFKIENIVCSYNGKKRVLEINELNIPKKSLVFIVGASGVGKSTFLETVGLMNKTILKTNEKSDFDFFPSEGGGISLKEIWKKSNEDISALRSEYFSFIFQQTNLMPHFSVEENMIVSQLINNVDYEKSLIEIKRIMKEISLEKDILSRNITELSGGQRQRLAFVRAFTASFDVLFGDEPTGNLDPVTARSLMGLLKKSLNKSNRTGLIVSHDIQLAIEFADIIIPIEYRHSLGGSKETYGYIHNNLNWNRKGDSWVRGNEKHSSEKIKFVLEEVLSTEPIGFHN